MFFKPTINEVSESFQSLESKSEEVVDFLNDFVLGEELIKEAEDYVLD